MDIFLIFWCETNFLIKICFVICILRIIVVFCKWVWYFLCLILELDKRIFLGIILSLGILVIIKLKMCIIFILCILLSILLYYYIKLCNNVFSKQEYQNAYLLYNCLLFIFNLFIQIFLTYSIGFAESAVIFDLQLQIQILNQDLLVTQEILNELQNSLHNSWWNWIYNWFAQWNYSCKLANILRELNELKGHLERVSSMTEEWCRVQYINEVKERANSSSSFETIEEEFNSRDIVSIDLNETIEEEFNSRDIVSIDLNDILCLNEKEKEKLHFSEVKAQVDEIHNLKNKFDETCLELKLVLKTNDISNLIKDIDNNMVELDRLDELVKFGVMDNITMLKIEELKAESFSNIDKTFSKINNLNK